MVLLLKKNICVTFIALLFCSNIFSQRVTVDSLQHQVSYTAQTPKNIELLLCLSDAFLTVNPDSSFLTANTALTFAKFLNNKELEAGSYEKLGEANDYVNRQTIALEYFLQARIIYEEIKCKEGLACTYYAIGEMYNTLKEMKAAKMYLRKSLSLYIELKDELHIADNYGSLGNVFFKEANYDSAQYYNNLEILMGKKQQNIEILQDAFGNIADVLIAQKKYDEALPYLLQANEYADKIGSYYGVAYGKNQLAKIAIGKKNYRQALVLADEIIAISKKLHMDDLLMDASEIKYITYKEMHEPDSALLYLEKYNALEDTLAGKKKSLALDSLLNKYRFEKKEKEVELLKQTNKSHIILIAIFCAVSILACWLMFFFNKKSIERKRLNAALQEQSAKLQNINQLKDKMFSIISHDLRGPIASLKALTDFMKSNSLSDGESEMVVKELRQSVNSVDMLLENLLVWAKMQINGNIVSEPATINILALVEESTQLYQKAATHKNILLHYKIEEGVTVFADRNYLSLILRNLINNAIKFTEANGSILIEALSIDHQIKICVADNGIGMSKDEIDLLFNLEKPFSKRGTMDEKGSGLGLLFVKEYTERCGGGFSITSEKGKGSKFCITFAKALLKK